MNNRKPFLVEVLCEEIPARIVPDALAQLEDLFTKRLTENRIDFEGLKTYGTPRRLTILVDSLSLKQNDITERITGPPAVKAFDEGGNPTEAAKGFARSKNLEVEDLEIFDTDKGKYTGAEITSEGEDTVGILVDLIPDVFHSLTFPRTMRWGSGNHSFTRPVRNLVVLLGEEVVETEFCGVDSTNKTPGHRYIHPGSVEIQSPDNYETNLKSASVIVSPEERRDIIKTGLESTAESLGGELNRDEDLLKKVCFLMEKPGVIAGKFSPHFLELPEEILITCMKKHQKYFALRDSNGELMPYFLAVVDIKDDKNIKERVIKGHKWVLKSRLDDAKFFWELDQKKSSEERLTRLENVIFQEGLGTYKEKAQRLIELSQIFGEWLDLDVEALKRAAKLCKTDLVTDMVNEFPSLQGIVGGLYAAREGEDETTADIIYHHYKPRSSGDEIPTLPESALLSLADKLDTLTGSFAMGAEPTGSKDPYGLRRKARSVVRIIIEKDFDFRTEKIIEKSYSVFQNKKFKLTREEIFIRVKEFLFDRLFNLLKEKGYEHDTLDAVFSTETSGFPEIERKVAALSETRENKDIQAIVLTFKRIQNIVEDDLDCGVDPGLFEREYEERFFKMLEDKKKKFDKLLKAEDYTRALEELIALRKPIDEFFEKVMVMVDDERLKRNRMALLKEVSVMFLDIADISKLDVEIK